MIDVIRQHHGTTLIQYFYHRARGSDSRPPIPTPATAGESGSRESFAAGEGGAVSETTYRYDGPKPQFKESAIIMLADGVEAASRSLRRVTPQHLGELIEQIFKQRLADGQLDEAPLTIAELHQLKGSFTFTLLNMLHARVAYPPAEGKVTTKEKDAARKSEQQGAG